MKDKTGETLYKYDEDGLITGGIEVLKQTGPLEGVTIGATIGSAVPVVDTTVGAIVGLGYGLVNKGVQFIYPDVWDDAKQGTFKIYDGVKYVGSKAIKDVSEGISNVAKDLWNWDTN